MNAKLLNLLTDNEEIADFSVQVRTTVSAEWFFIVDKLDQSRSKSVTYTMVKLYVDSDSEPFTRGHAEITIYPTHSDEEIEQLIIEGIASAKLIKNQLYVLPQNKPVEDPIQVTEDVIGLGNRIIRFTLDAAQKYHGEINSFEVFANHHDIHFVNAKGFDLHYSMQDAQLEMIVNSRDEKGEIELYRDLRFSELIEENLDRQLRETFTEAKDRAVAQATPALHKTNLILSGDNVSDFFGFYRTSTHASTLYSKSSNFSVDENIQENVLGDAVSFMMVPTLPGSCHNSPIDEDGTVLTTTSVVDKGIFKQVWGDARHCHYMEVKPTGNLRNMVVESGSKTVAEMETGVNLEVLDFSSFIVDGQTGDFGGEIRLGYLIEEGKKTPITGGSVSGKILDLHTHMYLSKERQLVNRFSGPLKVQIYDVNVSGIK